MEEILIDVTIQMNPEWHNFCIAHALDIFFFGFKDKI